MKKAVSGQRFLIKHVGNMGDHVFFIPPVLASLKRHYPDCHITLIAAWGFKTKSKGLRFRFKPPFGVERVQLWGERNQGGYCINLMMTNPHVDQLIHWDDLQAAPDGGICIEEGRSFPTWNQAYYTQQKESGAYDGVFALDFGLTINDNPLTKMYEAIGLPDETYSDYKLYFSPEDERVATAVMHKKVRPRIVLLEGLESPTTRGWDPAKVTTLTEKIKQQYHVDPLWFGGKHVPHHEGRPLTLRENIATLKHCDVAIGVLSGPLHFAAAVGLPTITLYSDQPLHRAAPAYFLNPYRESHQYHHTILGPHPKTMALLKSPEAPAVLTPAEQSIQNYRGWQTPGRQATKSGLAPITVDEVMAVLRDILPTMDIT